MIKHISMFISFVIPFSTIHAMRIINYQNKQLIHHLLYKRVYSTQNEKCGAKLVCKYNCRVANSCLNRLERAYVITCQNLYVEKVDQYSPWRASALGLKQAYKIAGCWYNRKKLKEYEGYIRIKLDLQKKTDS